LAGESNHASLPSGEGFRLNMLKSVSAAGKRVVAAESDKSDELAML
jgi:hypothetical protein